MDIYHNDFTFDINVKPLTPVLAEDAHQQLHPSDSVQVLIEFLYQIHSQQGQYLSHYTCEAGLIEGQIWNRAGSYQLFLSELKCFNLSFLSLSSELSKLGVEQEQHKVIVEKIVEMAYVVEAKIKEADLNVVLFPIQVELFEFCYCVALSRVFKRGNTQDCAGEVSCRRRKG